TPPSAPLPSPGMPGSDRRAGARASRRAAPGSSGALDPEARPRTAWFSLESPGQNLFPPGYPAPHRSSAGGRERAQPAPEPGNGDGPPEPDRIALHMHSAPALAAAARSRENPGREDPSA